MSKHLKDMSLEERVKVIWGDTINGVFCQEVSTLNANRKLLPTDVCPGCLGLYSYVDMIRESRDNEGEILSWSFRHSCGTEILVFND